MTSVDLRSLIDQQKNPQPETVTAAYGRLLAAVREGLDSATRELVLREHMADVKRWIAAGVLDGVNAASALFAGHSLLAEWQVIGRIGGGSRILGFVHQLSMSPALWAHAQKAMDADDHRAGNARKEDCDLLRLDQFPLVVMNFLFKRGEQDILREIFRGVRQALDVAARQAMSNAKDFNGWVEDLAVMAAYLATRRWLPLMIPEDDGEEGGRPKGRIELFRAEHGDLSGGRFIRPAEEENPFLVHVFDRAEIDTLHRKEAYAAECFAHFYASVMGGYIAPEHQQKVADEYARRAVISRLDARQWLALGKSRFEIAPYIA